MKLWAKLLVLFFLLLGTCVNAEPFKILVLPVDLLNVCGNYYCFPESSEIFGNDVINNLKPNIVTGDFNSENFMDLMNQTNKNYKRLFNEMTTVDDKRFDDILLPKEQEYTSKKIIKSLSDHFLLIVEIKI